jgi:hypothetical protein
MFPHLFAPKSYNIFQEAAQRNLSQRYFLNSLAATYMASLMIRSNVLSRPSVTVGRARVAQRSLITFRAQPEVKTHETLT